MNETTKLFRHVHPQFYNNSEISSQAFFPFPKDKGLLSVDDGDKISLHSSWKHYTEVLGLQSLGIWAVVGAEVVFVGLNFRPDPIPDNTAHAVIDFSTCSQKECRKLAKRLKQFAMQRGKLFPNGQSGLF